MNCSWRKRAATFLLVLLLASAGAFGQSKTTAGLRGKITDEKGVALPGAVVEIESPALIGGVKAITTDADGRYRFTEIAPGLYTVTVSMSGFQKVRQTDIKLSVGQTTDASISLYTATTAETVSVVGEATAIDPTSSAAPTVLPSTYLDNIPTSHVQVDTLNLAPGINLDSAFGAGGSSANAWEIDGVDTSDPEAGSAWSFVNYNIINEVQLVGLGAPAEYGGFTGVVFNSTTKSGGNTLSGLVEGLYSNESLTWSNTDIPGINPTVKKFIDSTAQLGGPILKDKLWYFASAQYFHQVINNGGPDYTETSPRAFAKVSWQINANNNLETWVEWDKYQIKGRDGDAVHPLDATVTEDAPEYVWNVTWKSVLSANTILNVGFGGYEGYYYLDPQNGYDIAGRFDANTGLFYQNANYYFLADRSRNQLDVSVTNHAADFIKGDHDFKFGMEVERSSVKNRYGYPTGVKFYDNYSGTNPNSGQDTTYSIAYYGGSYDVHAHNQRVSLFAQDSWRITPNFTINPGLRLDMNRGRVTGDTLVFNTNPLALRLGFAWDLTGKGHTLLKGHYGRYYEGLKGAYYYWVDPGAYEPLSVVNIYADDGFHEPVVTKSKQYAIDNDLKQPSLDQYILGLDQELFPGFTLSGTLIYRKNENFIETVSRDGVFTPVEGIIPTTDQAVDADDPATGVPKAEATGQRVTLYDYLNPDTDVLIVTNPKGLERTYKAILITGTKRLTANWQVLASYVFSEAKGNIDNVDFDLASDSGGQNGGPSPFLDTPNSLVNADGRLTHDQRQQMKLQGTYMIPSLGLSFSANWTVYSGDTWTRKTSCLLVDDGSATGSVAGDGILECHAFPQGTVRYFAETRGSRRLPTSNTIDLRGEWSHGIGPGKLGLILDLFNVMNQGYATEVEDRDGPTFGETLTVNTPRNLRVSANYTW